MERNHDYFWNFITKKFPRAVEEHYYDGIELDFYPSEEAANSDYFYMNLYSCHHDLETGELKIYLEDW